MLYYKNLGRGGCQLPFRIVLQKKDFGIRITRLYLKHCRIGHLKKKTKTKQTNKQTNKNKKQKKQKQKQQKQNKTKQNKNKNNKNKTKTKTKTNKKLDCSLT